jgi:hypothetical protein
MVKFTRVHLKMGIWKGMGNCGWEMEKESIRGNSQEI